MFDVQYLPFFLDFSQFNKILVQYYKIVLCVFFHQTTRDRRRGLYIRWQQRRKMRTDASLRVTARHSPPPTDSGLHSLSFSVMMWLTLSFKVLHVRTTHTDVCWPPDSRRNTLYLVWSLRISDSTWNHWETLREAGAWQTFYTINYVTDTHFLAMHTICRSLHNLIEHGLFLFTFHQMLIKCFIEAYFLYLIS